MGTFSAADPLGPDFRDAVGSRLSAFIAGQRTKAAGIGPEVAPLVRLADDFTAGGKRFRPGCCYWGAVAVAGQPDDPAPCSTPRPASTCCTSARSSTTT